MRKLPANIHSQEHGGVLPPAWFVLAPAYTVLPFLRGPLGWHVVHPARTIAAALGLAFLPLLIEFFLVAFINEPMPPMGHEPMMVFAGVYFLMCIGVWIRRWRGQGRGAQVHSAEAGYSWLAWWSPRWFPVPLIEIVVVPFLVFALAWVLLSVSFELWFWFTFASLSLLIMAQWEWRHRLAQARARIDDTVRAGVYEGQLDRLEKARARGGARTQSGPDFAELAEDRDSRRSRRSRTSSFAAPRQSDAGDFADLA